MNTEEITIESLEKKCHGLLKKCAELDKLIEEHPYNPFLY